MKKKGDLSREEDLSLALMNAISIEEHLFFTYIKTNNKKYLNLLKEVRELRKKWLKELIGEPEGEVWCISKHLLAASMRFIEVGTKYLSEKKNSEAEQAFEAAFQLYSLFWFVNNKKLKLNIDKKNLVEKVKKLLECCQE